MELKARATRVRSDIFTVPSPLTSICLVRDTEVVPAPPLTVTVTSDDRGYGVTAMFRRNKALRPEVPLNSLRPVIVYALVKTVAPVVLFVAVTVAVPEKVKVAVSTARFPEVVMLSPWKLPVLLSGTLRVVLVARAFTVAVALGLPRPVG